jgi:hypothetical protein
VRYGKVPTDAHGDEHETDAPGLRRAGAVHSVPAELLDGRLDGRTQSRARPRPEDLATISSGRNPPSTEGHADSDNLIVSEQVKAPGVKAPGGHRDATGLTIWQESGLSSWSHRGCDAPAPAAWTVPISAHDVATIVDDHLRKTLSAWLREAIVRNAKELERRAQDTRAYRSACWQLAGELRGHPLFAKGGGAQVAEALEGLIDWDGLPQCDSHGQSTSQRDALIDAIDFQYEQDVPPLGLALPPVSALEFAHRYPLGRPHESAYYAFTVSFSFWYARLLGQDGKFFLAVDTLARLLPCSTRTSSICLGRAVREKLIEVVRAHERHSRRAREYRWIGELNFVRGSRVELANGRQEEKIRRVLVEHPSFSDDKIARMVSGATPEQVRAVRTAGPGP